MVLEKKASVKLGKDLGHLESREGSLGKLGGSFNCFGLESRVEEVKCM